ncbi:MAG: sulfur transferase domain-containing protein [Rhodospirillaceae bacterium]|nr:sulfur transferase domain-containing protein [Rhodospirillaceae bacterium]
MNIRFLTGRFAVADGAPAARQIGELKAQGIGSVVSLRMAGERGETMAPEDEGAAVEGAGMAWLHFPLAPPQVGDVEKTDDLSRRMQELPAPVLIHCASGARAAAMAISVCTIGENWDAETAARKAADAGIAVPPELAPNVDAYVQAKRA